MANQLTPPGEAASRMLQLLNACLTAQALHVAAALGLADLLADGPRTADDLAAATGAHGPSLYRLLRMLTGTAVFREEAEGASGSLHSAGPCSARGKTRSATGRCTWAPRSRGRPGAACARRS